MCWYTKNYDGKTLVANRDISVFKIVKVKNNKIVPYYKEYTGVCYGSVTEKGFVSDGEVKTCEMNLVPIECCCYGYDGFHSYLIGLDGIKKDDKNKIVVDAHGKRICSYESNNALIAFCIIPKGSNYLINEYGECISESIKVIHFKK